MKKKFFDKFCLSFLNSAFDNMMDKSGCTANEMFEGVLQMAHEGERSAQTITALILRADGKPESQWSKWLFRAVSAYEVDGAMYVYGLYKYSISDSGISRKSCFGDLSYMIAVPYIFRCAQQGEFVANEVQMAMIDDFRNHYEKNKSLYEDIPFYKDDGNEHIAEKIYFYIAHSLAEISDGNCSLDEVQSSKERLSDFSLKIGLKKFNDFCSIIDDCKKAKIKKVDFESGVEYYDEEGEEDEKEDKEGIIDYSKYQDLARRFPSNSESKFYSMSDLPLPKINNFIEKSGYGGNKNSIIFYFDDTVFGKGDGGVVIDVNNVVVKLTFEETIVVPLDDINGVEISGFLNKKITLIMKNGTKKNISLTQSNKGAKILYNAIVQLVDLKKC